MAKMMQRAMGFMGLNEMPLDEELSEENDTDFGDDLDFGSEITPFPKPQVVSAHSQLQRIVTLKPVAYADALKLAEVFREGVPVILNVTGMKETDSRRMIDFASGLAEGLKGKIERVTNRVFLLSPESVTVTADDAESRRSGLF